MKRKKIICFLLSLLYSAFISIGYSFEKYDGMSFFGKWYFSFVFFIMAFVIYLLLNFIFDRIPLKFTGIKSKKIRRFFEIFETHPFLISLLIILMCWIPYIIAFYPGILSPDPSHQILQFFGIDNKYSYYSVLIDENMIITNHHPVLHTLLLGGFVKIGMIFGNFNFGLFLYSFLQTLILSFTLAYVVKFLFDQKMGKLYSLFCLIIFSIFPVFPLYAMSPVKDVIFSCLIILYIIFIYNYVKTGKLSLWTILLLVLIILFRNNGFHIIILSLPFLLLLKNGRVKILILVLFTLGFYYSYNHYILPYFHVTQTSVREMLSIPFQQTARYVKYYGDDITDEEKGIIDKILEFDTIARRYNPQKADPVKNEYNRFASNEDLKKYFNVWFKEFERHPGVYFASTINNTYGYYYPSNNWYVYSNFNSILNDYGFDYHYNNHYFLRIVLLGLAIIFPYIPFVGMLVNIGFSTWLLLFMISYLIYRKKYSELFVFIPMIIVFLVCLASPVNTYFRYAMPNIFAMPLALGIFRKSIRY